jgi:dTDP-4-dehydrorhamnose 3,5-epimerase
MHVEKTNLPNVLLLKHECYEDHRGTYEELYNEEKFQKICDEYLGHRIDFREDNIAVSSQNVLRGLHGDDRTWKYVTCLVGKYFINVLNYDEKSEFFGKSQSFVLSEQNKHQLLIPPLHGHGYCVMSERAVFYYKQSCIYQGMAKQFTIRYDDPRFNLWWPIKNPILSYRDDQLIIERK